MLASGRRRGPSALAPGPQKAPSWAGWRQRVLSLLSLVPLIAGSVIAGDAVVRTLAPDHPAAGAAAGRSSARGPAPAPAAQRYCTASSGQFTGIPVASGGYVLSPDEWNSPANMCLTTDGSTGFTVASSAISDRGTGAPGAYPNLTYVPPPGQFPTPVAAIGDSQTSWSTDLSGASGKYDVSYDIWLADTPAGCHVHRSTPAHELMIWINEGGGALPYPAPTPSSPTVTLQDATYQVTFTGDSPGHSVINYVATRPVTAVDGLLLRLFTADAASRGYDQFGKPYLPGSGYLCSVSAGFEIFSGNGGEQTTSFSYQPAAGQS